MIYYIENEYLKVGVKKFGCELTSIKSKISGYEYLWQGDASIWSGQSPILFPIIGRLIEDSYTLDGIKYEMPKHGFARRSEWEFVSQNDSSLILRLTSNDETYKIYPFKFELDVEFSLNGKSLTVSHRVKNTGEKKMFFSLGVHPAFNCEIGDSLIFSENETLDRIKIDLEKSLRIAEKEAFLKNEREIIITDSVFNEDALIFENVKSETVYLKKAKGNNLKFYLNASPYLGIWAKPGASYVCIEPWHGINDSTVPNKDFSEKEGIIPLKEEETFQYSWSAEFEE